jgi:hypothetical protein
MMASTMMERCQELKEQKRIIKEDVRAQDDQLTDAERYDAPRRTLAVVRWRLLQMTLLLSLMVWINPRAGRRETKGS